MEKDTGTIQNGEINDDAYSEGTGSGNINAGKGGNHKITKRAAKNIAMVSVAVGLVIAMLFTTGIVGAKDGEMPQMDGAPGQEQMQDGQQPPDMNGGGPDSNTDSDSDSDSGNSSQQPPDMSGNSGQQPPDMSGNSSQQPPDMGNGSGDANTDGQQGGPGGEMPGGSDQGLSAARTALISAEALALVMIILYLIMSGMNSKTFRETIPSKKTAAIFAIITVLASGGLSAAGSLLPAKMQKTNGQPGQQQMLEGQGPGQGSGSVSAEGATTVDGKEKTLNDTYESTEADQNAVLVTNGGTLTSEGATITKTSGDGSNTDSCDFYGVNAALLVNEDSKATVTGASITSKATMSNGVFCTGEGSEIEISDSTVTTSGERSCRGLDATNGGTIIGDNLTVSTKGGSCAALATDRGEGTVTVTKSKLSTEGAGSPVIYSTGDISVEDTEGTAGGSQLTVVEGKNKVTITNSELTASAAGNRGDVDVCGVMLYQSMSGDADEGTAKFAAVDSSLSIDKDSNYYDSAPMFLVTNTKAAITLTNTELNFGSGALLSAQGTSEWGKEGSNGGAVKLVASDQKLKGDIELDDISTLKMVMKSGSTYKGTINGDNKAKSVKLTLSKDSKIVLTGDSYVSSIDDKDTSYSNIDLNGYKLYVDGEELEI
ncbi:MAG: hypothetical protein K6B42_07200 [Clostridia bacterium]|nr:hypothetical protein [Clostridia bacterium]